MIPLFNHKLITSFSLFLDHQLLNGAQAYNNIISTGLFSLPTFSNLGNIYASPYKSWIYDSCISGAIIPSGFYNGSGQFLTRQSGIVIDFINGRIISKNNWGNGISGSFAKRDYNIYTSTEQEFNFWLENVYGNDKDIDYKITGANSRFYAPCVVLTNASENNEPYAMGGLDETKNTIRAYIISNSYYQQEGINSYFRDLSRQYFSLVSYGDVPITSSGDLKTGYYCYNDLCAKYGVAGIFIENVYNLKISQKSNNSTSFSVTVSEFDLNTVRQPGSNK